MREAHFFADVRREELPMLFAPEGFEQFKSSRGSTSNWLLPIGGNGSITVGVWSDNLSLATGPDFLLLGDSDEREFFAWVSTYMPHVFPITQNCRIFTQKTFNSFIQGIRYPEFGGSLPAWSGLVVGECLAQRGDSLDVSHLPLNACLATFSYAAGRARGLWGDEFEDSPSFGARAELIVAQVEKTPRRLRAKDIDPAWHMLLSISQVHPDRTSLYGPGFDVLLRATRNVHNNGELNPNDFAKLAQFFPPARNLEQLPRASAETRVRIFDDILASVGPTSNADNNVAAFTIAWAALSIGGGSTEHIRLLEPLRESMPMTIVWFCLLSGLMHERGWDRGFAGIARLVSRELAYSFNSFDAPRADVSWNEAMFLMADGAGSSMFRDVRRAQQRALSVELLPGVCLMASVFEKEGVSRFPSEVGSYAHREREAFSLEKIEESLGLLWEARSTLQEVVGGQAKPSNARPQSRTNAPDRSRRSKKGTGGSGSLI